MRLNISYKHRSSQHLLTPPSLQSRSDRTQLNFSRPKSVSGSWKRGICFHREAATRRIQIPSRRSSCEPQATLRSMRLGYVLAILIGAWLAFLAADGSVHVGAPFSGEHTHAHFHGHDGSAHQHVHSHSEPSSKGVGLPEPTHDAACSPESDDHHCCHTHHHEQDGHEPALPGRQRDSVPSSAAVLSTDDAWRLIAAPKEHRQLWPFARARQPDHLVCLRTVMLLT